MIRPAFDEAYAGIPKRRRRPPREAMFKIEPPPFSIIKGIAAFVRRKGPVRFTSMTSRHSLGSNLATIPPGSMAVLFTSTSILPPNLTVASTMCVASSALETSPAQVVAEPDGSALTVLSSFVWIPPLYKFSLHPQRIAVQSHCLCPDPLR